MKGYWLRCKDCGGYLIAKSKKDGRVETWHRDHPCGKPKRLEVSRDSIA